MYPNDVIHEGEEEIPDWVSIYFVSVLKRKAVKCNLCQLEIRGDLKSPQLLDHIKEHHIDIHELHKCDRCADVDEGAALEQAVNGVATATDEAWRDLVQQNDNPESSVGFHVEFLNINVLKDGEGKLQPVYVTEVTEPAVETEVQEVSPEAETDDVLNMQYVMLDTNTKRKYARKSTGNTIGEQRKRSWIWKYFDKLSNIIYRCNICNVVLSIKGCNTNNLNRHMRSRHPDSYTSEKMGEITAKQVQNIGEIITGDDGDTPVAMNTEEIYGGIKDVSLIESSPSSQKMRRSWIWSYFDHVSATQAQCKLCHRQIQHGGNATGNMNRHLKMIHHKTSHDSNWVWKVFEKEEANYTCKICQQTITRNELEVDMISIMYHLRQEHGVVSGDQIITGTDGVDEN